MLNIFYGGVLPDTIKRDNNPLDYGKILKVSNINPELLINTGSAINEHSTLSNFVNNLTPRPVDVIEIGTFLGFGSALLASYARTVFTFDIWYRNSHHIWNELKLAERINCYTGSQKFIDDLIKQIEGSPQFNFNFAFIDGNHTKKSVKHDFELVKFTKRVLFHDANVEGIGDFITEIGGKFIGEDKIFGYWEKDK